MTALEVEAAFFKNQSFNNRQQSIPKVQLRLRVESELRDAGQLRRGRWVLHPASNEEDGDQPEEVKENWTGTEADVEKIIVLYAQQQRPDGAI